MWFLLGFVLSIHNCIDYYDKSTNFINDEGRPDVKSQWPSVASNTQTIKIL